MECPELGKQRRMLEILHRLHAQKALLYLLQS